MIRKLLIALGMVAMAAPAQAQWYEATSNNFIVYSQGSGRDAEEFAAKLERFNHVLRAYHGVTEPNAANKLRVFLMSSAGSVGRLVDASSVAGYYIPTARALMMVGTRSRALRRSNDPRALRQDVSLDPEAVLLHEYTHHFMFQYFPATYPTWYQEGFAEFWGSTQFLDNDVVEVGLPADHRWSTFEGLGWLPLDRLLRARNYQEVRGTNIFLLYAQGWLLVRYAFENPERMRQIQEYLRLINAGTDYGDAANQAFGDVGRLNSELYSYAGRGRFDVVRLPFRTIDVGPIAVRQVRPAEDALMEYEIRMSQGYLSSDAQDLARQVRDIAGRYPDDPFAVRLLMEYEHLAGNDDAALAAAERLLRLEPDNARAMVTQGRIQVARLRAAGSTDAAAWDSARELFVRASRVAPEDPLVLEAFYDSYVAQGQVPPPEAAQNAIYTAMELAPSDPNLRYKVALDFEQRNMIAEAIAIIRPDAYRTPHRGNESEGERRRREEREERNRIAGTERRETAREMFERLQAKLAELPNQQQRLQEAQEPSASD